MDLLDYDHILPITALNPAAPPPPARRIRAVVSLVWPFSSSTCSCALLLGDSDFRLRRRRGQVRVRFTGPSAVAIAQHHVGIGDRVVLSLSGARWEAEDEATARRTPGTGVEGQLLFGSRLSLWFENDGQALQAVQVDEQAAAGSSIRDSRAAETPVKAKGEAARRAWTGVLDGAVPIYSSPAFVRRARLSAEGLLGPSLIDPFEELDSGDERSSKRPRFSMQGVKSWRFAERSPSPQAGQIGGDEGTDTPTKDDGFFAALQLEAANSGSLLNYHAETSPMQNMQPPPLPRLHMEADGLTAQSDSSLPKERSQHERPSTPVLQPISSESLPLLSPFPHEAMQPQFESFHPISSSETLPARDQPGASIGLPSGQSPPSSLPAPTLVSDPENSHHTSIEQNLVEIQTPSKLRKDRNLHPPEDDTDDESQRMPEQEHTAPLSKISFTHELSDTEEDDGEMYTNRFTQQLFDSQLPGVDEYHDTEDATEDDADGQTETVILSADDDSGGSIHSAAPPGEAAMDAGGDRPSSIGDVLPPDRPLTEQPNIEPISDSDVLHLPSVQAGVLEDSTENIDLTSNSAPQQERDRVMAQTYRSLFGFSHPSISDVSTQQQQWTPAEFQDSASAVLTQEANHMDHIQAYDRPLVQHQVPLHDEGAMPREGIDTELTPYMQEVPFQAENQMISPSGGKQTISRESPATPRVRSDETAETPEFFANTFINLEDSQDVSELAQTTAPIVTTFDITRKATVPPAQAANLQTTLPTTVLPEVCTLPSEPEESQIPENIMVGAEAFGQSLDEAQAAVPPFMFDPEPTSIRSHIIPDVATSLQELRSEDREIDEVSSQTHANIIGSPTDQNDPTAFPVVGSAEELSYPGPHESASNSDNRALEQASEVAADGAHTQLTSNLVFDETDQKYEKRSAGEKSGTTSLPTTLEEVSVRQPLRGSALARPAQKIAHTIAPFSPLNSQTKSQEQQTTIQGDPLPAQAETFPPTPQLTQEDSLVNDKELEEVPASLKQPTLRPSTKLEVPRDTTSDVETTDHSAVKNSTSSSPTRDLPAISTNVTSTVSRTALDHVTKSPVKKPTPSSKPPGDTDWGARDTVAVKATPTRRSSRLRAQSVTEKQEAPQEAVNGTVSGKQQTRPQAQSKTSAGMLTNAEIDEHVTVEQRDSGDRETADTLEGAGQRATMFPTNARKSADAHTRDDAAAQKEVNELRLKSTVHRTPARKSLTNRLSAVPEVLSGWFTPRRSSRLQQDSEKDGHQQQTTDSPSRTTDSSGIATSFSYFTPLSRISEKLNHAQQPAGNHIDLIAVVTDETKAPERSKGGPRDYFTIFHITDPSLPGKASVRVETFRPWHAKLPVAHVGDVVLLRGYAVKSRARKPFLLSTDASAWCVWRYSEDTEREMSEVSPATRQRHVVHPNAPREEVKGPPVELGEEERQRVQELRAWWHVSSGDQEQS